MTQFTKVLWALSLLVVGCGPGPVASPEPILDATGGGAATVKGSGGGKASAGSGGGSGGEAASACGGVPFTGHCIDAQTLEACIQPSGAAEVVQRTRCAASEACREVAGVSACRLVGECRDGDSRCGASSYEVCVAGSWTAQHCSGTCTATAYGATCNTLKTTSLTGKFVFEGRRPNAKYTDWGAVESFVDSGFLVLSVHQGQVIDVTTTDADGQFTLKVVEPQVPDDAIAVLAAGIEGKSIGFVVANPGFSSAGSHQPGETGAKPSVWGWSTTVGALAAAPHTLTAHIDEGSAAAWVFSYVNTAWSARRAFYGRPPRTVAVWVAPDVTWTCGACQWQGATTISNIPFDSQIVIAGGADEGYWSGAVIAHEFGHLVMASYGQAAFEGGPHIVSVPTFPGQAWSEGWATYHQADLLNQAWYYDKQHGGMFWFSLDKRTYTPKASWQRPVAAQGLQQRVDENEVSSMLWSLRSSSTGASGTILSALASPRMTRSPYLRGYFQHTWSISNSGTISNVNVTTRSAPYFADLLDALVCAGFSTAAIDAATEPATHFPYPSQSPLCH